MSHLARATDPATSHAAAAAVTAAAGTRGRILAILKEHGAMTDGEIASVYTALRHPPATPSGLRTRRKELVAAGLVRATERRGTTPTGRKTIIWEAVSEQRIGAGEPGGAAAGDGRHGGAQAGTAGAGDRSDAR